MSDAEFTEWCREQFALHWRQWRIRIYYGLPYRQVPMCSALWREAAAQVLEEQQRILRSRYGTATGSRSGLQ